MGTVETTKSEPQFRAPTQRPSSVGPRQQVSNGQTVQVEAERTDKIRATATYTAAQLTELLIKAGLTVVEQNGTVSLQPIKAIDSKVVDNFDGSYTLTNTVTQCAVLEVKTKVQAAWEVLSKSQIQSGELVFDNIVHENKVTQRGSTPAPPPAGRP